ncbi:hypothetical protein BT96DRAFT_944824 [Gymnopus androsaceus JB14]|uniref:Uncharacterized protein n=1 Tax=Gymnopus androsaceus JB14 TaxID=1447944 RepID=A0A6A4H3A9_9AGAR|nr:hypothetical protein BT96DRAFT_944824 [Gymnopus androsaceus JB14]
MCTGPKARTCGMTKRLYLELFEEIFAVYDNSRMKGYKPANWGPSWQMSRQAAGVVAVIPKLFTVKLSSGHEFCSTVPVHVLFVFPQLRLLQVGPHSYAVAIPLNTNTFPPIRPTEPLAIPYHAQNLPQIEKWVGMENSDGPICSEYLQQQFHAPNSGSGIRRFFGGSDTGIDIAMEVGDSSVDTGINTDTGSEAPASPISSNEFRLKVGYRFDAQFDRVVN